MPHLLFRIPPHSLLEPSTTWPLLTVPPCLPKGKLVSAGLIMTFLFLEPVDEFLDSSLS